ncbi:unnamed protein product [Cylicostephanus goldi]|uniref:Autophagy-related protein 2 n=1 Tax=Cylicostephanus goldi TaxID=71465 RepID=A0A3P6R9B3_CYLGO|nr:unnamed protein product [Cylicostephanus goldi]
MSMKLFTIHDITLFDKLTASQIKEMMYQYSSAEQPRRTCASMLAVRMVESHKSEGKMRVSMLPIKFNIDQDTMEFLDDFFQEVRTSVHLPNEVSDAISARPVLEVPASVSSRDIDIDMRSSHIYPSLNSDALVNLDVLTPEAAPSPIYDLSYLEHRSQPESPVKRPLADAPLTASASSSPDLIRADISTEDEPLADDDLHLAGDWSCDSGIRFTDPDPSVDRMLSSSLHDSFHPAISVPEHDVDSAAISEDLVDTSSDIADCSNDADRSTICDEETSTQMAGSSVEHQCTPEPSESTRGSTFFKEFIFSPAVSIYVDYHGKNKINVEKNGAVFGRY